MDYLQLCMESEKFLKPDEFARLLKAAKDDREKCILLLLAGACQDPSLPQTGGTGEAAGPIQDRGGI